MPDYFHPMVCKKPNYDTILRIKEQLRDTQSERLEKIKKTKGEKQIIDEMDNKIMDCISEGDEFDDVDDVDNNVNHVDA